nr:hypothetical protein [Candidatus Sigynarchaeota archaeon]
MLTVTTPNLSTERGVPALFFLTNTRGVQWMVAKLKDCRATHPFPGDGHWGFKYYHKCRFPRDNEPQPREDEDDACHDTE